MSEIEDQIRTGMRLVAEDVQPTAERQALRRPPLRTLAIAAGLVVLAAGIAVGVRAGRTDAAPRFVNDAFNYKPYRPGGQSVYPRGPGPLPFSFPLLRSLSAASANDGWIVGTDPTGPDNRWTDIAWRWDGTAWRNVPLPKVPGYVALSSVAAVGGGEAWAVGVYDYHDRHSPLVDHWDGQHWERVSLPNTGASDLSDVSADSPGDVWATGTQYALDRHGELRLSSARPFLLHWDGVAWSAASLPWAHPGDGDGTKVVATGPADVWVLVSDNKIEHWDGTSWQRVPAPFGPRDPLAAFDATSADDAWAVGSYGQDRHSMTLAAHWDGQKWQIAPTPNRSTDSWLSDVVAVTPDDVWAVGENEWVHYGRSSEDAGPPSPLFEHWDGQSWKVMPGATAPLWYQSGMGLAATGDGSAWAFGNCLSDNVLMRWNGSRWTIARHPPDQHWASWAWPDIRRGGFQHCRVSKR